MHRGALLLVVGLAMTATSAGAACNDLCAQLKRIVAARVTDFKEFRGDVMPGGTESSKNWSATEKLLDMGCMVSFDQYTDTGKTDKDGLGLTAPGSSFSCETDLGSTADYDDEQAKQESAKVNSDMKALITALHQAEPNFIWRRHYERTTMPLDVAGPIPNDTILDLGTSPGNCFITITLDREYTDSGLLQLDFNVASFASKCEGKPYAAG